MTNLSVIIASYNRASYLADCICSLKECGVPDLEVIVVDDGSTDDTKEILRPIKDIRYFYQENKGLGAARNAGFSLSNGRYIAFLDSDDQWLPRVPQRVLGLLDRHREVDLVFADALMGNKQEGFRSRIEIAGQQAFFELPYTEPEPGFRILERFPFFRRMLERNAIFVGSTIMRRETFERAGGFDPKPLEAEDWELWLIMASRMTIGYWPEPMAIYLRHFGSMSDDRERMQNAFCRRLENISRKELGLGPEEKRWVEECLRKALFYYAYRAWDQGDYLAARERFKTLIRRFGLDFQAWAYLSACMLPFGLAGKLRKVKQTFSDVPDRLKF